MKIYRSWIIHVRIKIPFYKFMFVSLSPIICHWFSHTGPLNTKQQKRLLDKRQCLHFTFPVPYPCPRQSKKKQSSKFNSQLSNRLKSAVSILFNDDQVDNMSRYKIPKENHSSNGIVDHLLQLNNDIWESYK